MPYEIVNPRFFPGNISGLGMTKDENGRQVDTRVGVRIDSTDGCLIEHPLAGEITLAYAVDGRLENSTDRVRALWLLNPGMAAHIANELLSMLFRADPDAAVHLIDKLHDLMHPTHTTPSDDDNEAVSVHDRDTAAPLPPADTEPESTTDRAAA